MEREDPIRTWFEYPPIPIRQFDWGATRESYEPPDSEGVGGGLIGWGRTEAEAIADLLDQEQDRREQQELDRTKESGK